MLKNKSILITGGSGLLAFNWALSVCNDYAVTLLLHHKKISIKGIDTDMVFLDSLDDCLSVLNKHQPDIVIHTAGLTSIEKCESSPDLAQEVNVDLARNMAIACSDKGIKLVHISTDHLFSGNQEMLTEKAKIDPVNNYAKTKFLGEQQVLENCNDALIIRTNFFGWGSSYRQSFSDFILNKLRSSKSIELFQDVFFSPILISELSSKAHQLIDINATGLFNIVGSERISKYDFGIKLANCFNLDTGLINKVSVDDKPNLVTRPKDMSLSNTKLRQTLDCEIASLDEQLQTLKEQENNRATSQIVLEIIPNGKHNIDSYISAIIPTIDRPHDLAEAVISILNQKYLPSELIIVDQSFSKASYNSVKDVYDAFDVVPKLVYLHEPEVNGLIEAKQRGVQVAKGDIISFLEDDVVLHPQYFENAVSIFNNNQKVMGCCGVISNIHSSVVYEYIFKLFHRGIFYDSRLNMGKDRGCQGEGILLQSRYLSGGISCYRRDVFDSVKFDTVNDFFMLEDIDFSTRAADFFGDEYFFISTNICLYHNMSQINRSQLKMRWQRKLREYITFYKKHSGKPWSLANLIWLLIGLLGESIVSSVLLRNIGPLMGTMVGLYIGIRKRVII